MTKEQLADIRRRAERDSGAWTGIVGEAIYDRRKLLIELDRLSRINEPTTDLLELLKPWALSDGDGSLIARCYGEICWLRMKKGEAEEEVDRLSRIEDKYNNLCP